MEGERRAAQGSIAFDRAAGYYDATRGLPPGVEDAVAGLFAAAGGLGPASRVLEVGIGTGRIALPLARRVGAVVGADLAAPMLARLAAKRGSLPVSCLRADATRLPLAAGSFDAAVVVHVFHLIPAWREGLRELARVLAPAGLLLLGGDDHARGAEWNAWRERIDAQFGVENVGVPRKHVQDFPEQEGWRPVREERLAFTRAWRPRDVVEGVAKRQWSMCWRLDDAQVEQAAEALRREFLARLGDLERVVEVDTGFWVRAFRPPA